jgi:hypothetical protein
MTGRRLLPAPPGFTDDLFYDWDHLNPKGATRMAHWLNHQLSEAPPPTGGPEGAAR